jgi:uncharacterized membrane protein
VIGKSGRASDAESLNAISQRVHEREIRRQVLANRIRKSLRSDYLPHYVASRIPPLLPELIKLMIGSFFAFWLIGKLFDYVFHASPLYTFAVLGLIYSVQATYYKYRLSLDPGYKIPRCGCAGFRDDNTEKVLTSSQSSIWRIPNSVVGIVLYSTLIVLAYFRHTDPARLVAFVALVVSAYLTYLMVVKIGSLCINCINVSALNVLILLQVLR